MSEGKQVSAVEFARKKRLAGHLKAYKEITRDMMAIASDVTSAAGLSGHGKAFILGQTGGAAAAVHNQLIRDLIDEVEREDES